MNINKVKYKIILKLQDEYLNLRNLTNSIPLNKNLVNTSSSNLKKYIEELSTINSLKINKDYYVNPQSLKVSTVLERYDIIYPGHIADTLIQRRKKH